MANVEYNNNASPIKRNKVTPKEEENNDDDLGKSETKFEQNNPVTVQPLNSKRKIKVEEVPEKRVFGLGLSGLQSDFDLENNNSNAVLTHSISLKKNQKNPEKRFTVPHEISSSRLEDRPGTADRKSKRRSKPKSDSSIEAEEI